MKSKEPTPNLTRDQLPDSLYSVNKVPITQYNLEEFKFLASQPPVVVPPPADLPEAKLKKILNLVQYAGRSKEGRKRSLANLFRRRKKIDVSNPVIPTSLVPAPEVPAIEMSKRKAPPIRGGKYTRAVLSKEEWDIYVETWNEWFECDSDARFTHAEDREDIHRLCMEAALQFRYLLIKQNSPSSDIERPYNESIKRVEKARHNLSARRRDRIASTKTTNNVTNVAVFAGQVPINTIKKVQLNQDLEAKFLENTKDNGLLSMGHNAAEQAEMIDADFEVNESQEEED